MTGPETDTGEVRIEKSLAWRSRSNRDMTNDVTKGMLEVSMHVGYKGMSSDSRLLHA